MQDPLISNLYLANLRTDPFPLILTNMLGLDAASNQKVEFFQKLMCVGHLQVLVYTTTQNSQLLLSEPGNRPLLGHLTSLGAVLTQKVE